MTVAHMIMMDHFKMGFLLQLRSKMAAGKLETIFSITKKINMM